MSITKYEQETSIWYNNEDDKAIIYTCSRKLINKMDNFCQKYPDTYKLKRDIFIDDECVGKEYILPKNLITIRSPRGKKDLTEEEIQKLKERGKRLSEMSKMRKNKNE